MRLLAIVAVVAQAGIAVTGSVVRVTGSGLGCPDWPTCFPGSLVPDPRYDVALLHQWVEFSNRLLTGALGVIAVACLLGALATRPRRRRLTWLAFAMPAGVAAQAVIGGVTVLTGLAWWTVSVHFLVSMVLVWLAVLLVRAAGQTDGPATRVIPRPAQGLVTLASVVLAALLTAGTLVTAAGPHAGDSQAPRLGIGVPALAQLHADLLVGYLGLLVGLGFLLRTVAAPAPVRRRYWLLIVVVLAQGGLGAAQYALGVPETLVSLHVLGASLVTAAAAALWTATTERPPVAGEAPVGPTTPERAEPRSEPASLSAG